MNTELILKCPVCNASLYKDGGSYFCNGARRHCFDISSSGHANLCPSRATGGDGKGAVRARTEFLRAGYYKPILDRVCEVLSHLGANARIVDAGCGEGYYTSGIAASCGADTYGFDLSKEAIISASKHASRDKIGNVGFFVGGIYSLPVLDSSADALVNIFAPCAESEFSRVLKDGGLLVEVTAGREHLHGLKSAVYDEVYLNEPRADMPKNMPLIASYNVNYEICLDSPEMIRSLFSMTPYSYRTSERDTERLYALRELKTVVDVDIFVYRKETEK